MTELRRMPVWINAKAQRRSDAEKNASLVSGIKQIASNRISAQARPAPQSCIILRHNSQPPDCSSRGRDPAPRRKSAANAPACRLPGCSMATAKERAPTGNSQKPPARRFPPLAANKASASAAGKPRSAKSSKQLEAEPKKQRNSYHAPAERFLEPPSTPSLR